MKSIATFILFTSYVTSAAMQPYEKLLKKIPQDAKCSYLRNIDFIYMINLNERPEKYEQSQSQLLKYDIIPYRFEAINGWKLSIQDLAKIGVIYEPSMSKKIKATFYSLENKGKAEHEFMSTLGRRYVNYRLTKGAIGITLSHLSILKDAYSKNYKTIWVMEDDIDVIYNPHAISILIDKLEKHDELKNWDILFTDRDTKDSSGFYKPYYSALPLPNFSPKDPSRFKHRKAIDEFLLTPARMGAYSMIIKKSGIKKILDFFNKYGIFLPYDMTYYLPDDIKIVSLKRDIVSTLPKAKSDNLSPHFLTDLISHE